MIVCISVRFVFYENTPTQSAIEILVLPIILHLSSSTPHDKPDMFLCKCSPFIPRRECPSFLSLPEKYSPFFSKVILA